ncbi:MAG: hypothetical protein R6T91_01895, partial [Bacteroidales bacterium]
GLRAMMEHGATPLSAPSLWIVVPIVTVVGIAVMRQGGSLFNVQCWAKEKLRAEVKCELFNVQCSMLG